MFPSAMANAQPNPPPGGHMALVEQIVRAAFPDLELDKLGVSLGPYPANAPWMSPPEVNLLILETGEQPPTIATFRPGGKRPFLRGRAQFFDSRFIEATFGGRYVNDDKTIQAGRELGTAGLSPTEVNRWLEKAGAMYPPDRAERLEGAIERSALVSVFGITKLHHPEFHWPGAVSKDSPPGWLVRAEGQGVDLALTCFVLFIEPFDGRLTRISAIDLERMDPQSLSCIPRRDPH